MKQKGLISMRKLRVIGITVVMILALAISASALTTIFSSKNVSSAGVTVTQTKCVNSNGDDVAAIYYLYNTAGDYSMKTLTGGTTSDPKKGTLKPVSSSYYGKAHTLYIEKGSGVTVNYTYTIN